MNAESGVRSSAWGGRRFAALLVLFCCAGVSVSAIAQDHDGAINEGREAFSKRNYPWYDASKDAARPIRVGADSETRSSKTTSSPSGTESSPSHRVSSGQGISIFGSGLQVLGLVILTAVLVGVAVLIVWAFLRIEAKPAQGSSVVSASRDVDRVEELPFALKRASSDFLAEAQRLAAEGNYSEAIIYLYSHLLVQLDRHHVIRLAKGKTNRQYLRETRSRPALAGVLETTMVAFEDVFFGQHELPKERFEECHAQVPAFHTELTQLERVAA